MTTDSTLRDAYCINQSIIDRTRQIKDLERAIKIDKAELMKLFEEGKIPRNFKDESTGISASLQTKRTWKYSDQIELAKQEEIISGVAEEKMTQYWTVRANNV